MSFGIGVFKHGCYIMKWDITGVLCSTHSLFNKTWDCHTSDMFGWKSRYKSAVSIQESIYSRELKLMLKSLQSGTGTDQTYQSKWVPFNQFNTFMRSQPGTHWNTTIK